VGQAGSDAPLDAAAEQIAAWIGQERASGARFGAPLSGSARLQGAPGWAGG